MQTAETIETFKSLLKTYLYSFDFISNKVSDLNKFSVVFVFLILAVPISIILLLFFFLLFIELNCKVV